MLRMRHRALRGVIAMPSGVTDGQLVRAPERDPDQRQSTPLSHRFGRDRSDQRRAGLGVEPTDAIATCPLGGIEHLVCPEQPAMQAARRRSEGPPRRSPSPGSLLGRRRQTFGQSPAGAAWRAQLLSRKVSGSSSATFSPPRRLRTFGCHIRFRLRQKTLI